MIKDTESIAKMIDISMVKTNITMSEIERMVEAAKHFKYVCAFAMPCFTKRLAEMLSDTPEVMVGGVVGFPSGADTTATKVAAAKELMSYGIGELDMVMNVGALKSGFYDEVYNDIRAVVESADGLPVKCILEVAYLSDDEIKKASELAVKAGVTYVKTGTGWAPTPTTVNHIKLIKSAIGDSAFIKAAGGVRDLNTLLALNKAGASRFGIGTNNAISIMKEVYELCGKPWSFEV